MSFEAEEALKRAMSARDYRIKMDRENGNKQRSERGYPLLPDLSNRTYADHIEPLIIVAMSTGMRKGELLSLTWADVNFEREYMTVKAASTKSGKARHVPLNPKAKSALLNWKLDCEYVLWVFEGKTANRLQISKRLG